MEQPLNPEVEVTPSANPAQPLPEPRSHQSLADAIHAASQDAERLAGEAAPKLKQAIRTVAYEVAYGAAFGTCFAAAFARELTPATLKESLARGARAGREAAAKAKAAFAPAPDQPAAETAAVCPAIA